MANYFVLQKPSQPGYMCCSCSLLLTGSTGQAKILIDENQFIENKTPYICVHKENYLLSTTRRICPKYGEIQTGMYFFCTHRRPGTMDNEWE